MPEMNFNSSCKCLDSFGKVCSVQCNITAAGPSYIAEHFPEWLAQDSLPGPGVTSLVDLGIREAREWMAAYLSDVIGDWDVDTFRIESSCNGGHDCLSFFQQHDRTWQAQQYPGVERHGTTEIGHTNGLHALFDELRQRHPNLVVDVCAGGGRKIDLDIMERSIHKWQSDYVPAAGTTGTMLDQTQGHLMGEQHYQPLSAAGISSSYPYAWRSVATTGGLIFWDQTTDSDVVRNRTAAAVAETKRLRPLILAGDFYHLTSLDQYGWSNISGSANSWAAWQWVRQGCTGYCYYKLR